MSVVQRFLIGSALILSAADASAGHCGGRRPISFLGHHRRPCPTAVSCPPVVYATPAWYDYGPTVMSPQSIPPTVVRPSAQSQPDPIVDVEGMPVKKRFVKPTGAPSEAL